MIEQQQVLFFSIESGFLLFSIGIKEACRPLEWTLGPVGTISPFFSPSVVAPHHKIEQQQVLLAHKHVIIETCLQRSDTLYVLELNTDN